MPHFVWLGNVLRVHPISGAEQIRYFPTDVRHTINHMSEFVKCFLEKVGWLTMRVFYKYRPQWFNFQTFFTLPLVLRLDRTPR